MHIPASMGKPIGKGFNWEKCGAIGQWAIGLPALWLAYHSQSPPSSTDVSMMPMQWVPPSLIVLALLIGAILHYKASSLGKDPDPSKLTIHYARYGIGTGWRKYLDVTDIVRGHIVQGNSLDIVAGHQTFSDPFVGKTKYTLVKYSLGGVTRVRSLPEGERLSIGPDSGIVSKRPAPVNPEVQKQMDGLLPFSQMALKHLVLKGGMTEKQFSELVTAMGFPFTSLDQQQAAGNILRDVANSTTLLTRELALGQWIVKPQFVGDVINYLSNIKD
jgi:hypothetical protein